MQDRITCSCHQRPHLFLHDIHPSLSSTCCNPCGQVLQHHRHHHQQQLDLSAMPTMGSWVNGETPSPPLLSHRSTNYHLRVSRVPFSKQDRTNQTSFLLPIPSCDNSSYINRRSNSSKIWSNKCFRCLLLEDIPYLFHHQHHQQCCQARTTSLSAVSPGRVMVPRCNSN